MNSCDQQQGKCAICQKVATSRCSWCRLQFYCSKEHQKEDWNLHKKTCNKIRYEVEENDQLGRYMIATEELKPDQILFKDKPIILGPKTDSIEVDDCICLGCHKEILPVLKVHEKSEIGFIPCPKCSLPVCSLECSKLYFHAEFECRLVRELKGDFKKDHAVHEKKKFLSRLRMNLLIFRGLTVKLYDPKNWSQIQKLESNSDKRQEFPNLELTTRVLKEIKNLFEEMGIEEKDFGFDKPDLHHLIGVIECNSAEIRINPVVELYGIYPNFSVIEHNCCPNTKFYFTSHKKYGFEIQVRSAVKIKSGEHIQISYTNTLVNTMKRREHLKKTKYFWCTCQRCEDPTELDSNFSTILCPICKGPSVPVRKTSTPTPTEVKNDENVFVWKCQMPNCQKTCEAWQVRKVDMKLGEAVSKIQPSLKGYSESMSKILQLVHPDYYLTFAINHSLIQLMGQSLKNSQNEEIPVDMSELEEKLSLCRKLLEIVKKLDPGLARLNIYTAVIYYEMHSAILTMAGGEIEKDYLILSKQPEAVKLAKMYLQKCIDCFKYEYIELPENKLQMLATKKIEYLNMITKRRQT